MGLSAFRKGALSGAIATLAVEGLVIVAVAVAGTATSRDERPNPTPTRREAVGTVIEAEPQLCVEGQPDPADDRVPRVWCGLTEGGIASGVAVGDAVVGSIIEVELDPGSGPAWSFWESLATSAD